MNPLFALLRRLGSRAFSLLAMISLLVPAAAPALEGRLPAVPAEPPFYADAEHVPNGCHLSTLAYRARFSAEFPHEATRTFHVDRRTHEGKHYRHTVALVTWKGGWWCRDEFLGVMNLDLPISSRVSDSRLAARILAATTDRVKLHGGKPPGLTADPALRHSDLATARRILPLDSTFYRITGGNTDTTVLFFRPAPGIVAVYDPNLGTAAAETTARNDAAIVTAIAERLGYGTTIARAETSLPAANTVALATR
jgi:hypothetical protein